MVVGHALPDGKADGVFPPASKLRFNVPKFPAPELHGFIVELAKDCAGFRGASDAVRISGKGFTPRKNVTNELVPCRFRFAVYLPEDAIIFQRFRLYDNGDCSRGHATLKGFFVVHEFADNGRLHQQKFS